MYMTVHQPRSIQTHFHRTVPYCSWYSGFSRLSHVVQRCTCKKYKTIASPSDRMASLHFMVQGSMHLREHAKLLLPARNIVNYV